MPTPESHSLRNGVFATVVGGIILAGLGEVWPPIKTAGMLGWNQLLSLVALFTAFYSVPGWLLAILGALALATVIQLGLRSLREEPEPEHHSYVQDRLFGAVWRWSWTGDGISNLWCFCPTCDSELVYDDSSCAIYSTKPARTDFVCEHCNGARTGSIQGGDNVYAIAAVQREIRRKIRTDQYKQSPPAAT